MFYLVGLGLGDAKDITVKGLEVVKQAKRVYLEAYTSILTVGKDALVSYSKERVPTVELVRVLLRSSFHYCHLWKALYCRGK